MAGREGFGAKVMAPDFGMGFGFFGKLLRAGFGMSRCNW